MIELFSEKVQPTFTSSNHNIITVENYEEVFFDVFEFEINGTKYIAEKQTSYRGKPVVSIPVVEEGVRKEIPFILVEGDSFNVLYNKQNTTFSEMLTETAEPSVDVLIEDEVVNIVEDYKGEALGEVRAAMQLAQTHAEEVKRQKLQEAKEQIIEERKEVERFFDNAKSDLLGEFNSLVIDARSDLEEYAKTTLIEARGDLESYTENKFLSVKDDLSYVIDGVFESSKEKIETVEEKLTVRIDRAQDTFIKEGIQLNDKIDRGVEGVKKGVDKALGRLGSVKLSLGNKISDLEKRAIQEAQDITCKIEEFYDRSLEDNKQLTKDVKDLIKDSKTTLLEQVRRDIDELRDTLVTEEYNPVEGTKEFSKGVKKLKKDLERLVNDKFTLEISSLKRLIELSGGGGGTVAVQYADGGTMNGDLIVNGCITARCFIISNSEFEDYALDSIFRDVLSAAPVDQNTTQTFNIRTCPRLAMAKFHAVYTGCDATHNRSFVELFVGIEDENAFVNGYSVIHTDENNPVLTNLTCSVSGGYLNIISDVSVDSSAVLTGRGTYIVTPPFGVAGCGESCDLFA